MKSIKIDLKGMLVIIATLFIFMTMLYQDSLINSNIGYNFIDSVFSGSFKEYYNKSVWAYGISIYAIYAVWSIPVWSIFHLFGLSVNLEAIPVLLWYKLLLVLFAFWSVYLVGKIADELYGEKKQEIQLQYMTSFFFVFPIFAIAQCDIIGLCFVLLGLYYYIQGENKKFILSFAVAVTMKYFALLVFIPLILLRFRKLSKILSVLMVGAVFLILSMIVVNHSSSVGVAMSDEEYFINTHIRNFSAYSISLNQYGDIGLLGMCYVLLCVVAFKLPNGIEEKNKLYAVWLSLAGYACFFLLYPSQIYWFVLLAPFLILVSYMNPSNIKLNLILELLFGISIAAYFADFKPWGILGNTTFSYLLLKDYGQAVSENAIVYTLKKLFHINLPNFVPAIRGVGYACIIALLVINFPKDKRQGISEEDEKEIHIVTWIRAVALYAWIFIALYCLVLSQRDYYFTNYAMIDFTSENEIKNYWCEYEGDIYRVDEGGWIPNEFYVKLHTKMPIQNDLRMVTNSYTSSMDLPIYVYVNDYLVGKLQKENEELNITNRFLVIPKEYFHDSGEQIIKFVSQSETTISNGMPISICMEKLEIKSIE